MLGSYQVLLFGLKLGSMAHRSLSFRPLLGHLLVLVGCSSLDRRPEPIAAAVVSQNRASLHAYEHLDTQRASVIRPTTFGESHGESGRRFDDSALPPLPSWFEHVRVGYDSGFVIASDSDLDLHASDAPFRLRLNGWGHKRSSSSSRSSWRVSCCPSSSASWGC